jgi:hypothetical protein
MLEGNVVVSSSIGRGLAQEAALTEAKFLIIGSSRNSNQYVSQLYFQNKCELSLQLITQELVN